MCMCIGGIANLLPNNLTYTYLLITAYFKGLTFQAHIMYICLFKYKDIIIILFCSAFVVYTRSRCVYTHRIIDFYREKVVHFIIRMSYPYVWLLLLDRIYVVVTFASGRKSLISRRTYYFFYFFISPWTKMNVAKTHRFDLYTHKRPAFSRFFTI